jgi:hypothetical protein
MWPWRRGKACSFEKFTICLHHCSLSTMKVSWAWLPCCNSSFHNKKKMGAKGSATNDNLLHKRTMIRRGTWTKQQNHDGGCEFNCLKKIMKVARWVLLLSLQHCSIRHNMPMTEKKKMMRGWMKNLFTWKEQWKQLVEFHPSHYNAITQHEITMTIR